MEQPEFCYDEFGFRVDKEGKMDPWCVISLLSVGRTPALVTLHCAATTWALGFHLLLNRPNSLTLRGGSEYMETSGFLKCRLIILIRI